MTIRHLQIFRVVCECQSITKAAAKLNMTQPAVSIAVKELESYYQTKLFDRMNRKIYLTGAGSILREYADAVLDQFEEAAVVLRDKTNLTRCSLGVNVSVGETILAKFLKNLEKEAPGLRLEVFVGNAKSMEQKLDDNEIDLAVADSLMDTERRVILPLHRGEMAAVCRPGYGPDGSAAVRELLKYRLLLREKGSGSRACIDAMFEAHGCLAKPAVESISDLCLLNLAEAGLGITFMPRELIAEKTAAGRLKEIPLRDEVIGRRYFAAYNKKKYLTASMKQVLSVLRTLS